MKKRSSKQIRNLIILFAIFMMLVLIGLIIFLLTVDVKNVRSYGNGEQNVSNVVPEKTEQEDINISDYELIKTSANGDIEIRLSEGKLLFSVKDDDLFKENYPHSVVGTVKNAIIATHENTIVDFCIGKIDEKNYVFVLTDKGSVGVMDIDDAVNTDVFRIKNKLISLDKPVVRVTAFTGTKVAESADTVIATTEDGKKYDLTKFVE